MSRSKKLFTIFGVITAFSVTLAYFKPWEPLLAGKLREVLENKGLENVELSVSDVGLHSMTLSRFRAGQELPLTLENLAIGYDPGELLHGRLDRLALKGLNVQVRQTEEGWQVAGLAPITKSEQNDKPAFFDKAALSALPFRSLSLENSNLSVSSDAFQLSMPFAFFFTPAQDPMLGLDATSVTVTKDALVVSMHALEAKANLTDGLWRAPWSIKAIQLSGMDFPIPELSAKGELIAKENVIAINAAIDDAQHTVHALMRASYPLQGNGQPQITIENAHFPWLEGMVIINNTRIPLKQGSISGTVSLRDLSLQALLKQLLGDRVTASGQIHGHALFSIPSSGTPLVQYASIKTLKEGTIQLSPDVIPGDQPQLVLLRDVLSDFHYSRLELTAKSDKGGKLSANLRLEGNNPAVYEGKPVKLNVNLGGDVLEFAMNGLLPMADPETFLKRTQDAQ